MPETDPGDAVRKIIEDEHAEKLAKEEAKLRRLAELKKKHDAAKQAILELCDRFGFEDILRQATEAMIIARGLKNIKFRVECSPTDFERTIEYKKITQSWLTYYELRHNPNYVCCYSVAVWLPKYEENGITYQGQGSSFFFFDENNLRPSDPREPYIPFKTLTKEDLVGIAARRIANVPIIRETIHVPYTPDRQHG